MQVREVFSVIGLVVKPFYNFVIIQCFKFKNNLHFVSPSSLLSIGLISAACFPPV